MENVISLKNRNKKKPLVHAKILDVQADIFEGFSGPIESKHLLISMLLPPAVKAFMKELESEVDQVCGEFAKHGGANVRWGSQSGSIVLGNQHVAIERPRVRRRGGSELDLETYKRFQDPRLFQEQVFAEGLKKVSQRDYQKGLQKITSSFGVSKSSVSRKWINVTAKKIEELQRRDIKALDIRAVFIDGKRFSKYGVIIALGVSSSGKKYILGIYQASSENHQSCMSLLNDLEGRGLPADGLLFIVDGGSGLNKALNLKYQCDDKTKRRAIRIRCHIHKWRNIEKSLGDSAHKAKGPFWALRDAKNMTEAKGLSDQLESILRDLNKSALESYLEAKEDLLAMHDLKLSRELKKFFSTTNPIESLNSLLEEDMRRVKRWKNSEHFQRWLATFCLQNEKRMHKVRGYRGIPALWITLREFTNYENEFDFERKVG
jgi:transposase-like protein